MSQDDMEGKPRPFEASVRTERHLARSLEDVSHLFLSKENAGNKTPNALPRDSVRQVSPHPGERSIFLLEDQSQNLEKGSLVTFLKSNAGALEEGLKTIDANVPIDSGNPVDLVAVDRFNKLCLIDIDISGGDDLLLHGICHFDWFVRNVPIVRRMYHDRVIDFSVHPRIFLAAPKFSAMFLCAARRIACTQIHCYLCSAAAGPGGTGILLTRI